MHTNLETTFVFFFFKQDKCFRAVLGSQQNWEEDKEISHVLPPVLPPPLLTDTHMHSLPHHQHPPP